MHNTRRLASFVATASMVLIESIALAQVDTDSSAGPSLPEPVKALTPADAQALQFTFVRLRYTSQAGFGSTQVWATDWPEADFAFSAQLEAITGIPVDGRGLNLELTDSALWSHPFVYLVEGGKARLSDTEVLALRDYLNGGGFLLVDDFWGEREWDQLAAELDRVFPGLEPVDLWPEHEIFEAYFDIEEQPLAPGFAVALSGLGGENGASIDDARIRGLIDPAGRLVAILCHNMDLGDAWEHYGDARYPREYALGSLMFGVNAVVYALTH